MSEVLEDRKVIVCNLLEARDGVVPADAKCYLSLLNPGGGHERVQVLARSRGGRWIVRWENLSNLHDFREKTLPAEHPRYGDERVWTAFPEDVDKLWAAAERDELAS